MALGCDLTPEDVIVVLVESGVEVAQAINAVRAAQIDIKLRDNANRK
jgi:hypothetical protein